MRIGLMTYDLPSASKQYISNSPYFVSFEPKSYCPTPPSECVDFCATGSTVSKTVCHDECTLQNTVFDETYMDEVITARSIGDAKRTKYCGLVYPKTQSMKNPSDPTRFVYYKQALPFYSSTAPGNQYFYASSYSATNELTAVGQSTSFTYSGYTGKTNTNDTNANYTGSLGSFAFGRTDSDLALGYGNFGRRNVGVQTGRTWFANSSPGGGLLQIPISSNDSVNTQKNLLLTKLTTYSGDETGYMACTNTSNPDACSYIVNAGLTPTAGTLQTASTYLSGTTSPIQQRCQKNFIIYVTDGLPSVNSSGTVGTADALIGADTSPASGTVLNQLDALHSINKTLGGTSNTFDVNTYFLGLGLTSDAKTKLSLMAKHGGTSQAYYADNVTQLNDALDQIFRAIDAQISSGTAASILSNSEGSGANLLQAVFFPKKIFENSTEATWIGEMQNLWYYVDPFLANSTIREDTDYTSGDHVLDLVNDYAVRFYFNGTETRVELKQDTNGDGSGDAIITSNGKTDDVNSIWRAGKQLWTRLPSDRTIHTSINGLSLVTYPDTEGGFSSESTRATNLQSYLNAGDLTATQNIIKYIRGEDQTGYRSRKGTPDLSLLTLQLNGNWEI